MWNQTVIVKCNSTGAVEESSTGSNFMTAAFSISAAVCFLPQV